MFTDGAALFYTTPMPATLQVLRQYALHLLFIPPAPSPASLSSATDAPAPIKNPFPFPHKPNTLDRDRIVVPAGWDSWGKVAVLRDGFDAKVWGEAWGRDLEDGENVVGNEPGAKRLFRALVPDQGIKVCIVLSLSRRTVNSLNFFSSLQHYHPSATQPRSKHSSPKTMTRIPKSPIRIRAAHSVIHWKRMQQQASSVHWEAAALTSRTLNAH
jgi:hypothetical protein